MYIITVSRITSGELLKYRKGLRIVRGYGSPRPASSQFALTQPDAAIADDLRAGGLRVHVTNTVMESVEDRENLAREVLGLATKMSDGGD